MEHSLNKIKQAWLNVTNKPAFAINVTTTVSLTVGVLLCAITLMYLMLFKPLPYPEQDTLFVVEQQHINQKKQHVGLGFSYPAVEHFFQHQQSVKQVSLNYYISDVISSLPEQPTINSAYVGHQWFDFLKIPMALGKGFTQEHGVKQFTPVAVLSYQFWQEQFNLNEDVVGKSLEIRGVTYRIIGITAENFVEPEIHTVGRQTQIWLPWDYNWTAQMQWGEWGRIDDALQMVVKLADANTAEQQRQRIESELQTNWSSQLSQHPTYNNWKNSVDLVSFKEAIYGEQQSLIYYIFFGCLGVFLIATANITNLYISRTLEQQRTLSIHAAVGANKKQITGLIFTESALIMAIALPISLMIAAAGFQLMQHYLGQVMPRASELSLSGVSIFSALAVLTILNVIFTLVCSNMIQYKQLKGALSNSGKGTGIQVKQALRQGLIAGQVAIATALIFINLNLFQEAYQVINAPMGIEIENSYQLRLAGKTPESQTRETLKQDMQSIKAALLSHPAVEQVSISLSPLIWFGHFPVIEPKTQKKYTPESKFVDQHYFDILSQPLLYGDNFSAQDIYDINNVVIINDVFADELGEPEQLIGQQLEFFGRQHRIIGIVKGIKRPLDETIPARRYTPDGGMRTNIIIKTKAGFALSEHEIIQQVNSISSQYNLFEYKPLTTDRTRLLFTQYTTLIITSVLTVIAIFLATLGLYGILSYSSQMRRFEIGTRMAVGAKGKDIIKLIFSDNSQALFIGIIAASSALLALYLTFSQQLQKYINVTLLGTYLVTLVVIIAIALYACYMPLRQYIKRPAIHSLRGSD